MSWPLVELGELCNLVNGDRGKNYPSKGAFVPDGIPFINAGNLGDNHEIDLPGLNFIAAEHFDRLSNGKIQDGDVLFCLRGSIGKFAKVNQDFGQGAIASSLVIIRVGKKINVNYLLNYLKSTICRREIDKFENGAAQPNLSAKDLGQIEIPLPPLKEQKRIAVILDKADAIRRKRQQAIKLADDFLRSVFLDMFGDPVSNPKGWEVRPLSTLTSKITDGTHKTPTYISNGVPFLSAKNIKGYGLDWTDTKFISQEEHEELIRRCKPELGDILLSKSGSLGTPAIVDVDKDFSLFESAALLKPLFEKINPLFLLHFLRSKPGKCLMLRSTKGVAIKHLHLTDLRELPVIVPPMEIQAKFAQTIDMIISLTKRLSESTQSKDMLFNSLSQKAFSGQL